MLLVLILLLLQVPIVFILGPLLCLIYVNDKSATLSNKLLLHADDSGIHVSGKINLHKFSLLA
jgi:hypothetical protein